MFAVLPRLQQIVCLPGEEPVAPASNSYGSAGMHRLQQHDLTGKGKAVHEQARKKDAASTKNPRRAQSKPCSSIDTTEAISDIVE